MSRATNYVGVVNYMGARFTGEDEALAPVLADVGQRGLLYLDDGSSARSRAAELAGSTPVLRADVVLDADLTPAAIDAAPRPAARHRPQARLCHRHRQRLRRHHRPCRRLRPRRRRPRRHHRSRQFTGCSQPVMSKPEQEDRRPPLPPQRRHRRVQQRRPRVDRPPQRRRRRGRGRRPLVADAPGRPRQGRGPREVRLPRALRGNLDPERRADPRRRRLAHLRPAARAGRRLVEGPLSRPEAEVVRAALHRRGIARSTCSTPAAASTSRSSRAGAGSISPACRSWSCRSSARSTSRSPRRSPTSPPEPPAAGAAAASASP